MTFFCSRLTTVCLNSLESLAPSPVYVVLLSESERIQLDSVFFSSAAALDESHLP